MAVSQNPLLALQFPAPFDRVLAAHVEPAVDELLARAGERLEALAAAPGPRTYADTMAPLDDLTQPLDYAVSLTRHLEAVATYPELRAAYNAIQPKVSAFYTRIPLHEGLWKALRQCAAGPEAGELAAARRRFLTKTIEDFRRHGAELEPDGKRRLEAIDVELSKLTTRFSENVLDSTNAFELVITDEARLAGLPPTALDAARQNAAEKGIDGWRFTLQAPSYIPLMTYLDDAAVREQVYRAYNTRATRGDFDNGPILHRILELRREKASLLGFPDFASFVLEDRMAHSPARAGAFLEDLKRQTEERFHQENQELAAFRRKLEGPAAPPLEAWDVAYYAEKLRRALYDFDEESLRPYFPLPRVLEGMFSIFSRTFGIRIEEKHGVPAWDPATRYFEIRDRSAAPSDPPLGAFYADFHPRENKRGGAWMDSLITGVSRDHAAEPHLGVICANLTPPLAGRPALLTHREVETIFHEFGHLLHHCLSRTEIRSQAGTNVAWDFVELPSQIMENWCWERQALDQFARHYETGEPIPDELFQRMKRARTFRSANAQMRQLGFGVVDMTLHTGYDPQTGGDAIDLSRRILADFSPAPLPPEHAMLAGFTHLFSSPEGYAAGYYSYKWAEVLDADAFTRFQQEGIFNPDVGRQFRQAILERGDSADPAQLYRAFMGRDPDPEPLLKRLGLR